MIDYNGITYEIEAKYLSPYAQKSADTQGRRRVVDPCNIRTEYQRDRDRIIHCKSFRRLKHKTQVFVSPEGDHYRTRLTHTLEVSQIARTMARALRLNEDLVEAISLGHDLGHTPFGHAGERLLDRLSESGFAHNKQSLRVVDILENDGEGLNLTYEVRDGILNHTSDGKPKTLEGKVVSYADRIAYINHDIDDAVRGGILREEDLPTAVTDVLGNSKGSRIDSLVRNVIDTSFAKNYVCMSAEYEEAMSALRSFMFDNVYTNANAKSEEGKAVKMLETLFYYYCEHTDALPEFYRGLIGKLSVNRVVTDYIASMSDNFAVKTFERVFVPRRWEK